MNAIGVALRAHNHLHPRSASLLSSNFHFHSIHQSDIPSQDFGHRSYFSQAIMTDNTDDTSNISNINSGGDNQKRSANNKQRKASKWKQMKQKKKEQKRRQFAAADDAQDDGNNNKKKPRLNHWKREYDEGKVTPHEGSFAHVEMQKLFNVKIDAIDDVPTDKTDEKDGVDQTGVAKEAAAETEAALTTEKIPKRKLAFLVSFLGSNYSGFQINSLTKSIHAEIELGLYRAGLIAKSNFGHPSKYAWSNSARTDKGVHAAAQVCSFKGEMIYHHKIDDFQQQLDAMREKVNECLPEDVRILDFERVTRTFCARTSRDKVRYQYMVPSFMLCSREDVRNAFAVNDDIDNETTADRKLTPMEASKIVQDDVSDEVLSAARSKLLQHRVSEETLQRLTDGLKLFEGTHSFHNYTRRVGANDATATRYIIKFAPLEPVLVPGCDDQPDTQWIPVQVTGQSFLLNQIRKMISAAVDLARGVASTEQITQTLSKEYRMKVNVAPAHGLFLDRSFFDLYNKHKVKNAPKHGNQPELDILNWVEEDGKEIPAAGKSCDFV
jgi:tRNA pseudouridine38-40 synthase